MLPDLDAISKHLKLLFGAVPVDVCLACGDTVNVVVLGACICPACGHHMVSDGTRLRNLTKEEAALAWEYAKEEVERLQEPYKQKWWG